MKAEHCLRLDVRALARGRVLAGGVFPWRWTNSHTGEDCGSILIHSRPEGLQLLFTQNGQPCGHAVGIVNTACHYGGTRPWLLCPPCGQRVAVLYLCGGRFTCRHCARVAYACQSEDAIDRAWRRQSKLEAHLGPNWQRPKGMHHATRRRLLEAILACKDMREQAFTEAARRLGFLAALRL